MDRERLKTVLRRDGKVVLWQCAAGFADDERLSADLCEDLTGIRLRMTERQWSANLFVSNFEHELTRDLPTSTFWGTDMRLGPLFTVDDSDAITLGTAVINQGRCEPGFALKSFANWTSVYSAAPNLPPGMLRNLASYAGVHLYSRAEDVLYASRSVVALHTVRAGEKTIHLPSPADVSDAYSGRIICVNQSKFVDTLAAGETRVYRIHAG